MKKFLLVAILAVFCVSCRTRPGYNQRVMTNDQVAPVTAVAPTTTATYNGNVSADMYRRNIVAKTMGEDYVIYEYSDVKIEDVATLAYHYCQDTNPGKKAYLRDIYMTKNHKRRATFDCVNLATE